MDTLGYLFDPITRVLIGTVGVQESPLETGHYLLPPNCTVSVPLPPMAGKDVSYINGSWVYTPSQVLPQDPADPITDVRQTMQVSAFQGQAALLQAGLLDQVEAYFAGPDATPLEKLAWNKVLVFERLSPLVVSMGTMLNLNDQQLDQLFISAAEIKI